MKSPLTHLKHRIDQASRAFQDREDSQQISARIAKLVTDTGSGKLKPSEIAAKGVALYLRRQHHVHGDQAYRHSLDEIMAFLSEAGELEQLYGAHLVDRVNQSVEDDTAANKRLVEAYRQSGLYGVMRIIEHRYPKYSDQGKAGKLLEAGKILKTKLNEEGIRTQIAQLAIGLDQSEPTYRGACWSMLNDNEAQAALEPYAYLYYYYQDHPQADKSYFDSLKEAIESAVGQDKLQQWLRGYKEEYTEQKQQQVTKTYQKTFNLTNRDEQQRVFAELIKTAGSQGIIELLDHDDRLDNRLKASLALRAARAARQFEVSQPEQFITDTLALTDYAYRHDKSEGTLRNLYFAYQRINAYEKASEVIELLKILAGDEPSQRQRNLLWSTPEHLARIIDHIPERRSKAVYQPISGKVCYVIHNSLPYSSGGYATRGHGLLTGLMDEGVAIYALSRPGYPHDITSIKPSDVSLEEQIEGVTYKRLLAPSRRDYSNYEYMLKAADSYEQAFLEDQPALVMAASNHLTALPALIAARRVGIPFVYEIRGFWEVTHASRQPEFLDNPMYAVEKRLEAVLADKADYVFTLTQGMVDELADRQIDVTGKITLLPNSCDIGRFDPLPRDEQLAAELAIPDSATVIGYVGTFVSYEGLDDLAMACGRLKEQGHEFRLLLVGNENATGSGQGSITEQVQQIAEQYGYADWLIMPGRVPFEAVGRYYSLIDIAPFPRKPWPVCEIVPPMKTLEALALEKAVVVSSNTALTEMITHDKNGRVFEKGNVDDLVTQLTELLTHPERRREYGQLGRDFVANHRTWQATAQTAKEALQPLLK